MRKIDKIREKVKQKLQERTQYQEELFQRKQERWLKYYNTSTWKQLRAWKMSTNPCCEMCMKYGRAVSAEHVHHKKIFGSGATDQEKWQLFTEPGNLISVCKDCHDEFHKQMRLQHKVYIDEIVPKWVRTGAASQNPVIPGNGIC